MYAVQLSISYRSYVDENLLQLQRRLTDLTNTNR